MFFLLKAFTTEGPQQVYGIWEFALFEGRDSGFRSKMGERFGVESRLKERERLLTTVRANQTTGLTNGRAANWVPEVELSPFRGLTCRQMTFPSCC